LEVGDDSWVEKQPLNLRCLTFDHLEKLSLGDNLTIHVIDSLLDSLDSWIIRQHTLFVEIVHETLDIDLFITQLDTFENLF
jgi:hypothetical protein